MRKKTPCQHSESFINEAKNFLYDAIVLNNFVALVIVQYRCSNLHNIAKPRGKDQSGKINSGIGARLFYWILPTKSTWGPYNLGSNWSLGTLLAQTKLHMIPCPFLFELQLGFYVCTNWRLLKSSWAPLSFALWIKAKLLCFCLCLFNAIVELHAMDE